MQYLTSFQLHDAEVVLVNPEHVVMISREAVGVTPTVRRTCLHLLNGTRLILDQSYTKHNASDKLGFAVS